MAAVLGWPRMPPASDDSELNHLRRNPISIHVIAIVIAIGMVNSRKRGSIVPIEWREHEAPLRNGIALWDFSAARHGTPRPRPEEPSAEKEQRRAQLMQEFRSRYAEICHQVPPRPIASSCAALELRWHRRSWGLQSRRRIRLIAGFWSNWPREEVGAIRWCHAHGSRNRLGFLNGSCWQRCPCDAILG
eukprot:g4458.t1